MATKKLAAKVTKQIAAAVDKYAGMRDEFDRLVSAVQADFSQNSTLAPLVHSVKFRTKDPEHLRGKLERKAFEALKEGKEFGITEENLFKEVEDLAGVRLLHLHTKQVADIHPAILTVVEEHRYKLMRKAVAYTWDIEHQDFFKDLGIKTVIRESMYTSLHYVLKANRKTEMRCELQVRTLMEEVWGEVSHTVNYPVETESVACREQLRVLARVASGCTRLVDSIFASEREFRERQRK